MGNYGRFDRFVDQYDPYGTGAEVQDRLRKKSYNQGIYDQAHSGPSITDINEARRQALYDNDIQGELADDKQMRDRGENDYERSLDKRGLLTSNIDFNDPSADPRVVGDANGTFAAGHGTLKVRGKVDPATAALLKEAAEQGLIGGGSPWTNSAENRTALAALMEGKKADAIREQARADTLSMEDKRLQAMRDMRTGDQAAAAAASDRDFGHQAQLFKMKQDAEDTDPTGQLNRQLLSAQIDNAKLGMQHGADEYMTPQQRSAQAQAQALAIRAQSGDPEAYHALKMLTADPKVGINAETYRPSAAKVIAQPVIQQKLGEIDSLIGNNKWHLDANERNVVMSKAREAVEAAGDFGPEAQQAVKQHILLALSNTGSLFDTLGASNLRNDINGDWSQQ